MAQITIDDKQYEVTDGDNLLQACLSNGIDLPYFCWHPAMGSVGACRQCAIVQYQDENDERGRIVMGCMTPVSDGLRFSVNAENAVGFRATVIEWLMLNHPHDCPVCEEGGECHLQDMTVMTGHTVRRYTGKKRTYQNQYLGPFINHEMNRCITCYRCVRFYKDYAGGTDLQALGSRNRMYFGRTEAGVLESEFSGNLVEVCPTGVFTNKPFSESYTRKWDLQSAPSVCMGCAVGCNTSPGERYGRLKRIQNRYNADINAYFLCDRGRFGSGYVNSEKRIRHAGIKCTDGSFQIIDKADALERFAGIVSGGRVIGIGSPRASIESNYAVRSLVGAANYCAGFSDAEEQLVSLAIALVQSHSTRVPSLKQVEAADAVLLLGEDVSNTAPRLALALRQTSRNVSLEMAGPASIPLWQDAGVRGHAQSALTPVYSAMVLPTRIDDICSGSVFTTPARIAVLGDCIARLIQGEPVELDEADSLFVNAAAQALMSASKPLVVSGTALQNAEVLQAADKITHALIAREIKADLLLCFAEANSVGAGLMGAELSMNTALQKIVDGEADALLVTENDLYRRADPRLLESVFSAAMHVVAIDVVENDTLEQASLVLPAASFVETEGCCINYEGRAQLFYQVYLPENDIQASWQWVADVSDVSECELPREEWIARCASEVPALSDLARLNRAVNISKRTFSRIPRQTHRFSGRTAMNANKSVHEPRTPEDKHSPFSYSMEGDASEQPGDMAPYVWAPGWNSNQSVTQYQESAGGALRGIREAVIVLGSGRAVQASSIVPAAVQVAQSADTTGLYLLPLHCVFASDELSARTKEMQARAGNFHLTLNPVDAKALQVASGDGVVCTTGAIDSDKRFEVRVCNDMQMGYAGLVQGLAYLPPGVSVIFERDENWVRKPEVIARG